MKKRPRKTIHSPEWRAEFERVQRLLADRIAYHERKLAEELAARAKRTL